MKTLCALFLLTAASLAQTPDPGRRLLAEAKQKFYAKHPTESERLLRDALAYWTPTEPKPTEYLEALSLLGIIIENRLFKSPEQLRPELEPLLEKPVEQLLAPEFPAPNAMAARVLEVYGILLQRTGRESDAKPVFARAKDLRFPPGTVASPPEETPVRPPFLSPTPSYAGKALKIGHGVSAPAVLHKADPKYSEEARVAHYEGTVVLFLVVDENGNPRDIRVIRNLGLGLDENAIEAVQKWRFRPGQKRAPLFPSRPPSK